MSSYIDRDLTLAGIEDLKKSPWYNGCNGNYERLIRREAVDIVTELYIKQVPTADVAEVKHGEWKLCYEDWRKQIAGDECSVCGFQHFGVSISHYPYCPNCGARMDGGDFDEMPNIKSKE